MKNFRECFVALGLVVVMVVSVFAGNVKVLAAGDEMVTPLGADGTLMFTGMPTNNLQVGDSFSLTFVFENNPGFSGMNGRLFVPTGLEVTHVQLAGFTVPPVGASDPPFPVGGFAPVPGSGALATPFAGPGHVGFGWGLAANITNRELLVFTFRVAEGAAGTLEPIRFATETGAGVYAPTVAVGGVILDVTVGDVIGSVNVGDVARPTPPPVPAPNLTLTIPPLPSTPLAPGEEVDLIVNITQSAGWGGTGFANMMLAFNIPAGLEVSHLALGSNGLAQGFAGPPGWSIATIDSPREAMEISTPVTGRLNLSWNRAGDYTGTNQELLILTLRARQDVQPGFSGHVSMALENAAGVPVQVTNAAGQSVSITMPQNRDRLGRVRFVPQRPTGNVLYGDANGDGVVDILDVTLLRLYVAGLDAPLGPQN